MMEKEEDMHKSAQNTPTIICTQLLHCQFLVPRRWGPNSVLIHVLCNPTEVDALPGILVNTEYSKLFHLHLICSLSLTDTSSIHISFLPWGPEGHPPCSSDILYVQTVELVQLSQISSSADQAKTGT